MKIFRRLRQKWIKTDFKKYFLYAIGEIVLVVIGILIALGINNRQEDKRLQKYHRDTAAQVLVQVKEDLELIKDFRENDIYELEHNFLRYFDRAHDTLRTSPEKVVSLMFSIANLEVSDRATVLIDNADLRNSEYENILIDIAQTYKKHLKPLYGMDEILLLTIGENLEYLRNQVPWFEDLMIDLRCNYDCQVFIKTDQSYRNRMANMRFTYIHGYGGIVENFYDNLKAREKELSAFLHQKN
ncbi:hypothetical protein ACFQ1M_07380 [Sungkyunkwania multivorans]|uniref:Uncharacterized protein n=1 Tax=Sungkyunkwania multivorans TaxID=1173618 RepID=A0ABW3CYW8_9FLAO